MLCSRLSLGELGIALLFLALLVLFTFPSTVEAQVLYGSIVGDVTDPSGAVVAGATIRIVNIGTGFSAQAVTNESGSYTLQDVPAGTYDLIVTASGFSSLTKTGIQVSVNTLQRQDIALQVGQATETVRVEASAVLLQTDRADVSVEISEKAVTDLPLPRYRNFQSLINLVPGATPARFQNANTDSPQRSLQTNVNGTTRNSNATRIDGTVMNQLQLAHVMYIPTAEAIEVVNITTSAADAEQGLAGGSSVTVQTKSGTNQFHGSVFGFNQTNFLQARDFFFKGNKAPKNIINIDGFSLGGPVKRDKLFFFAAFELTRERTNFSLLQTVPTTDQRAGNFSAYNTTIYDPQTGDSQGRNRTPFVGNIVPQIRINPITTKIQDLIPLPNLPGLTNNYFSSGTDSTDRRQIDTKGNYNLSATHTMFLKWGQFYADISGVGSLGKVQGQCLCTGGAGHGITLVNTSTFGQTKTFTPNFVYDMAIGWSREAQTVAQTDRGKNIGRDVLGIPGTNGDQINQSGWPVIRFNNGYFNGAIGNYDNWMPAERHEMVYDMTQNFSWIKGNHNIRFGGEIIHNRLNHFQPGPATQGDATFTDGATRSNGAPAPAQTQYNTYAAFLLGQVQTWVKGVQWEQAYAIDWQYGLYVRDRWQVNRKLTLTYGLRWEKYPMMHRAGAHHPGIENYDPATNIVSLGGNGGLPSGLGIDTSNRLFTPRLGIAYRLTDRFVIRTGYGMNIDPQPFLGWNRAQWPDAITGTFDGINSFVPFDTWQQGIPPVFGPPAGTAKVVADPAATINFFPDFVRRPKIQTWNFTLEGRVTNNTVVSAAYVGSEVSNLRASRNINYALPGQGQAGKPLNKRFGRTAATNFSDGFLSSNYHSLQLGFNQRMESGLSVKAAYTWAHNLGEFQSEQRSGEINFFVPELASRNYTNAPQDIRHNVQAGVIYELPFGQGKKYLTRGLGAHLLGHWQLNGIFAAYTGRPYSITSSSTACNCPNSFNTFTADVINPNYKKLGSPDQWFDKTAFASVTRRTGTLADYGNLNTYTLRAPGMINVDASVFRDFTITEKIKSQFRLESYNISNTPHFNPPDANTNSPTFMVINSSFGSRFAQDSGNRGFRFALKFQF